MKLAMRHGLLAAMLLTATLAHAAEAPDPGKDFAATLAATRYVLQPGNEGATGPAADWLRDHAAQAQFVMIGEEHGVATIADTVRTIAVALQPEGYRHFALEADPVGAAILERELRAGGVPGFARWMKQKDHRTAIAFYGWSAEAALAEAVVRGSTATPPVLWGLDQVFIGLYSTLLADIAQQASSGAARELAGTLARQAEGNLDFLARVDADALPRLRNFLDAPADRALAAQVDDMILSARIYAPFIGREGLSEYAANLAREDLMKRRFLDYWRAAGKPKVLLKFGANHMARGLSPTHVPSLGNFLSDLALAEGGHALNLLVLCGPGTVAGDFQGNTGNCEIDLQKLAPALAAALDATQPTLFDLGPWKDAPAQWRSLPDDLREAIWAYDALLVVPHGTPARFLE